MPHIGDVITATINPIINTGTDTIQITQSKSGISIHLSMHSHRFLYHSIRSFIFPPFFTPMFTPTRHDLCISNVLIVNLAVTMCKAFIIIAPDVMSAITTNLPVLFAHSFSPSSSSLLVNTPTPCCVPLLLSSSCIHTLYAKP